MKNLFNTRIDFVNVDIVFIYKKKNLIKYCKKRNIKQDMHSEACTVVVKNYETREFFMIICVDDIDDVYAEKSLLVHEMSHVVTETMEHYAMQCDELRSYLLQYLYGQIIPFYDSLK